MRLLRSLLVAASLLSLWACGYQLQGRVNALPEDVRSVRIELFKNQTLEPFVDNRVTNEVVSKFARGGALEVVEDPESADAILDGAVVAYSSSAVSYDERDRIVEYRSRMSAEATLRRRDTGRVLWKGVISWFDEYPADADNAVQEDNEARVIEKLSRRIADELYARVLELF